MAFANKELLFAILVLLLLPTPPPPLVLLLIKAACRLAIALGRTVAPSEKDAGLRSSSSKPGAEMVIVRIARFCWDGVADGVVDVC